MKRVIIESPFSGDVQLNIRYARLCVRHSIDLGEAPFASHLLYTQEAILSDRVPEERTLGLEIAKRWMLVANVAAFYVDLGMSPGMLAARQFFRERDFEIQERFLPMETMIDLGQWLEDNIKADPNGKLVR